MQRRKRVRLGLTLTTFAVIGGLACALVAATAVSARTTGGARKDTLILGQFRTPTGYYGNVYVAASDPFVSDGIHQLVYEPLFYDNPETGKLDPWLATGFKYDRTFTHVTITLRKGVTWNDGVPLTSKDAVWTMREILSTKPTPYRTGNIQASVTAIRALGPYAFVITLKQPNSRFIYTDLSTYIYTSNFMIVPEHIFKGQDFKTFTDFNLKKGWPIGTGPYRVGSASQTAVTLTRNDEWWAAKTGFANLPAPKQIIYTSPGPEDTAVANLVSSKIDYSQGGTPTVAGFISAQKQNPKLENWNGLTGYDDPCPWSFTVNTQHAPWDDPSMRWALSYAINKTQFSQLLNTPGPPTPAISTFPPFPLLKSYLAANKDLFKKYPTLKYSPSTTAQILQAHGYKMSGGHWVGPNGSPLTLTVSIFNAAANGPVWQDADALIQQQLQNAGFTVKMVPGDFGGVVNERLAAPKNQADWALQSWFECGSVIDPWATLHRYANTGDPDGDPTNWANAKYSAIVNKIGQLAPTDPSIPKLFRQALTIYLQELPVIPLAQRPTPVVMNQTYWKGWPTAKDAYTSPAAHQQYFHEVVLHLKPVS